VRWELDQIHWTDSNSLVLLQNGVEFFPALCAAINTAKISVHLETYIFCLDRTGRLVLECLEDAAPWCESSRGSGRVWMRRYSRRN
jgi:cardiolipin synthase A/B